jgi:hypothetical protein
MPTAARPKLIKASAVLIITRHIYIYACIRRGKMISRLLPLLICIFFVLCATPASSQDSSISFGQGGSSREPFDVAGAVVFSVPITNNAGGSMRYTIDLTVGPDTNDYQISEIYQKFITVNAHDSSFAKFDVNFRSPKMSKGEFGKWAFDKNDTTIWDRAWYSAQIVPLVGEARTLENYEGQPKLVKVTFGFKNGEVSPKQGTGGDLYTYKVTALGSYQDNITLEVAPSREGPWTDLGTEMYQMAGTPQTLTWENKTLSFDFNAAYYRFSGRKQSNIFEGPFWPVDYNYSNMSVNPVKGLSGEPFTYTLELNASKSIDVVLNVLDINSKTFVPAGRVSYNNASHWETLVWRDIQPSEIDGVEGSSFYYFSFHYPGSESPFSSTHDKERRYYRGPEIVLVNFRNPIVSPENGSALTPYNYCVEVDTALPVCDIDLQTSTSASSLWKSQGIVTYDGSSKMICWDNVVLDSDMKGKMRYRFIRVGSTPEEYSGPTIGTANLTSMVEPYNGSLYFTTPLEGSISKVYTYTYQADLKGVKEPIEVKLEIYDPVTSSWIFGGSQTYDPNKGNLSFSLNMAKLNFKEPFLGEMKYRFLSKGRVLGEFPGPYIDVNIRNETVEEVKAKITYRAEVRSSLPKAPVALAYTVDNNQWQLSDSRMYESPSQGWKILEWKEYPRYYETSFGNISNSPIPNLNPGPGRWNPGSRWGKQWKQQWRRWWRRKQAPTDGYLHKGPGAMEEGQT